MAPEWAPVVDAGAFPEDPDDDRFMLTDDDMADWALRKIAKAQARIVDAERMRDERVALAQQWCRDATASDRSTVDFMTGLLEEYHGRVLDQDPDRKTIHLPAGRVKSRTSKPAVEIADLDALIEWMTEDADRAADIQWVPKIGVRDVRKFVVAHEGKPVDQDLGEVVPGLSVRDTKTTFTVEVS